MPLRYERAALSADNPIGLDLNAPPEMAMPAMPNLERAQRDEGSPCFGPVAPTWRARRKLLDEAATFWAYGIARDPRDAAPPLGAAPPRFDFAFFNAAPADQQIDLLRPGTPIVLDHLHPRYERLETRFSSMRRRCSASRRPDAPRARVEEIMLRCDSLWIDSDRGVAVASWRGLADLGRGAEGVGRIVVAADPEGKKLRWDRVEKWLGEKASPTLRLGPDGLPPPEDPDPGPPPDPLARRHDTVKGQRGAEDEDETLIVPAVNGPESGIYDAPTTRWTDASTTSAPRRCPSCRARRSASARPPPRSSSRPPRSPGLPVFSPPPGAQVSGKPAPAPLPGPPSSPHRPSLRCRASLLPPRSPGLRSSPHRPAPRCRSRRPRRDPSWCWARRWADRSPRGP